MKNLKKHLRPKKNFKRIKPKTQNVQNNTDANNNNDNLDKVQNDQSDNYLDISEYNKNNIKIPESEVQKSTDLINYINSNRQSAADRETMIKNPRINHL